MLRDIPHCKSILTLGVAGMIVGVVMLTWIYPAFCSKVSQVKETKVRELMHDRYGIPSRSGSLVGTGSGAEQELSKVLHSDAAPAHRESDDDAVEGDAPSAAVESVIPEQASASAGSR
ncbi:MAG: hypothetical protein ACOX9R_03930 [Armatimonadota bacterium]|jgi:hypothetical protein